MKHKLVLSFTLLLLLISSFMQPTQLAAQEPDPAFLHPYGKAWEARRPSAYVKQIAPAASASAPLLLQPSAFANEHRMVFESYRDGKYEIYAADGDGNSAVRLSSGSGLNRYPKLRAGAISVAFTYGNSGSRDLRSVRKDGSALTQLSGVQGFSDVAWSPDGTKLTYARRTATTDVYLATFDFMANVISGEVCLTCGSGRNAFEPALSPDGKQIVFVKASATEPKGALWRMNADGTSPQQLTGEQWWIADVRWSPDGSQVAFDYAPSRDAWQRLGALTLATGKIREVYNPNQDRVDAWMGSWSPNSQMLFFTRVEFVEQDGKLYIDKTWIERVNATGDGQERLPGNSGLDAMPSVQRRDLIKPTSRVLSLLPFTRNLSYTDDRRQRTLNYEYSDEGGSGLTTLKTEYRIKGSNAWKALDSLKNEGGTPVYSDAFLPSGKIYFRSKATDLEGNEEDVSDIPNGDTFSTLYNYAINLNLSDMRGIEIPRVSTTIYPTPVHSVTNVFGDSIYFMPELSDPTRLYNHTEKFSITVRPLQHYATPLSISELVYDGLDGYIDHSYVSYFRGKDDVVTNGSLQGGSGAYDIPGWLYEGVPGQEYVTTIYLSQKVYISPTVTNPTLAFVDVGFKQSVWISDGITSTRVFSTEMDTYQTKLTWIDMNRWLGKQITLTFRSGRDSYGFRDVSLSSWLTPVPTQTSITQLSVITASQQITLTGTNFIATPMVKLNNTIPLSNVQWLTDTQLIADLPANLGLGIYDLWVTNPGGQESVLQGAIKVGIQTYLPVAMKDE